MSVSHIEERTDEETRRRASGVRVSVGQWRRFDDDGIVVRYLEEEQNVIVSSISGGHHLLHLDNDEEISSSPSRMCTTNMKRNALFICPIVAFCDYDLAIACVQVKYLWYLSLWNRKQRVETPCFVCISHWTKENQRSFEYQRQIERETISRYSLDWSRSHLMMKFDDHRLNRGMVFPSEALDTVAIGEAQELFVHHCDKLSFFSLIESISKIVRKQYTMTFRLISPLASSKTKTQEKSFGWESSTQWKSCLTLIIDVQSKTNDRSNLTKMYRPGNIPLRAFIILFINKKRRLRIKVIFFCLYDSRRLRRLLSHGLRGIRGTFVRVSMATKAQWTSVRKTLVDSSAICPIWSGWCRRYPLWFVSIRCVTTSVLACFPFAILRISFGHFLPGRRGVGHRLRSEWSSLLLFLRRDDNEVDWW